MKDYKFTCNACGKVWTLSRAEYRQIGREDRLLNDGMLGASGSNLSGMERSSNPAFTPENKRLYLMVATKSRFARNASCPNCKSKDLRLDRVERAEA